MAPPAAKPPSGPPLFQGDGEVVGAWHARARRDRLTFRLSLVTFVFLGVASAAAEIIPYSAALLILAAAAALYPIALVETGGRMAQRPTEVYEEGVVMTERRPFLRFRRFATWPDIALGNAREVRPGRFHLALTLIDGTTLASIPGELSPQALAFAQEKTGEQVHIAS
jgi:hypothetical protein